MSISAKIRILDCPLGWTGGCMVRRTAVPGSWYICN